MKASNPLLLLVALLASITPKMATAQTYDLPANQVSPCSPGGGLYCYSIPVYLNGDTSQPKSTVWVDLALPSTHFACFPPYEEDAVVIPTPLSHYGCNVTIDPSSVVWGPPKTYTSNGKTATFPSGVGLSIEGVGTMALTLTYHNSCGRYGCSWYTSVSGATLVITAASSSVTPESPIAPTPVCLPGPQCPPHDWNQ